MEACDAAGTSEVVVPERTCSSGTSEKWENQDLFWFITTTLQHAPNLYNASLID